MEHVIYKEKYQVYPNGDIIGIYGKKLRPRINQFGYSKAVIYFNGKKSNEFTHRIIAFCFIPNPLNKPQVNHINGIKTDNRVENLEWVTNSENQRHAFNNGLMEKSKASRVESGRKLGKKYGKITGYALGKKYGKINTAKKVINIVTGEIFISASEAAKSINVNPSTLRAWLTIRKINKSNFKYI